MSLADESDLQLPPYLASVPRALLEAFPLPVLLVGVDLRLNAANTAARDLLPSVRLGDPLVLSLRDPNVLDAARRVSLSAARETVSWRERVPFERIFSVTIAAVDLQGSERALLLTLDDLTEARRIERMRADFIANASHELRTPLASLLGFVETLQGPARDDPEARRRFLDIMAEQARRMARLIDDLLSLSRIEQKRHIRPCTAVDLSAVVRLVADTLGPMAHENGVRIVLDVENQVAVPGDHDELVRVAENLIENAIKYGVPDKIAPGSEQPVIEVGVKADGRRATLSVRDQGAGIAPEHLPRLTERFYRVDAGQSRSKGGTGLGLALVKHIVAHHRGSLLIDSVVGQGSVITVVIPTTERTAAFEPTQSRAGLASLD